MCFVCPAGRFAFVELRTEELATTAMTLDKTELLGRPMNIGRPKGYVPGTSAPGEKPASISGSCADLLANDPTALQHHFWCVWQGGP